MFDAAALAARGGGGGSDAASIVTKEADTTNSIDEAAQAADGQNAERVQQVTEDTIERSASDSADSAAGETEQTLIEANREAPIKVAQDQFDPATNPTLDIPRDVLPDDLEISGPTLDEASASAGPNVAAESEAVSGVRAYADGSLRTADGKFASISGVPAPGTANASRFADFLSSNGVDVVGQELEVSGPLGPRRYDIVTRNPDGTLHGLEIKSGGATSNAYQQFTDMFINRFGATGRGQIAGQQLTGTSKVYLPSGGQ